MTLGDLILELDSTAYSKDWRVLFEDGNYPNEFDSYRGIYRHVALDWGPTPITVAELLDRTRATVGRTFQGYKGGDFHMDLDTPIWVAQYGDATGIGLTHVRSFEEGVVTLLTADVDDYLW